MLTLSMSLSTMLVCQSHWRYYDLTMRPMQTVTLSLVDSQHCKSVALAQDDNCDACARPQIIIIQVFFFVKFVINKIIIGPFFFRRSVNNSAIYLLSAYNKRPKYKLYR